MINTTLLSDSSPLSSKLAVHLFPNFIISCMALKKQCEIGYWIEGSKGKIDLQASFKDCCPRCGKSVASLQDCCCDSEERHSTLSIEMQQQLLLNWMAVASYKEKSAGFWRCARCVLLAQWLSQSTQKHWLLSKRRLPDHLDLDNVPSVIISLCCSSWFLPLTRCDGSCEACWFSRSCLRHPCF